MASAKALIDKFIADLEHIYKSSALATVQATLKDFAAAGGMGSSAAAAPAKASNRKKSAKKAAPETKARSGGALSGSTLTSSAAAPSGGAAPAQKGKRQKAAAPKAKAGGGRMGRRSPGEIEATTHRILSYIKSHPMTRGEQIKKALGLDKAHWILPIQRLVETKQVIARGERRATTYSAPDAKPAAPAPAAAKPAAPKAAPAKPSVPPPAQKPGPVPPIKRVKRS